MRRHPDLLGTDPRPLFFPLDDPGELGLAAPPSRLGQPLRTWVRCLAGMQKEALVVSGATGRAWRLASDEGPYLAGHDAAPCPLSFVTAGMVSSYADAIAALARREEVELGDLRLTLDNHYSMEGSALAGTMTGGAAPPELHVEADTALDPAALRSLAARALAAAPVHGLLGGRHTSLFTLTHNGRRIDLGRVAALQRPPEADPGGRFDKVAVATVPTVGEPIRRLVAAEEVRGVPHGAGSSLQESQRRTLHVRGVCTVGEGGVKEIEQHLYRPIGSTFRYRSDEAPEQGGHGSAPDAATLISAGIAFCFMTQLGRYAEIARKELTAYRLVQDTHFSPVGAGGTGRAEAVETHLHLESGEDDAFARRLLDMGEQTCFLHALCRTELATALLVDEPRTIGAERA